MYTSTTAPDGTPLRLTHRRVQTGKLYRVVTDALDLNCGTRTVILANEHGALFVVREAEFYSENFSYVPGGQ